MKKVLVPVDGSPEAIEKLRAVVREGPGNVERIEIVNVQPLFDRYASRWMPKSARAAWRAERARAALAPAMAVMAGTTIPWRAHVLAGPAHAMLAAAAHRLGTDEVAGGLPRAPFLGRIALPAGIGIAALVWLAAD